MAEDQQLNSYVTKLTQPDSALFKNIEKGLAEAGATIPQLQRQPGFIQAQEQLKEALDEMTSEALKHLDNQPGAAEEAALRKQAAKKMIRDAGEQEQSIYFPFDQELDDIIKEELGNEESSPQPPSEAEPASAPGTDAEEDFDPFPEAPNMYEDNEGAERLPEPDTSPRNAARAKSGQQGLEPSGRTSGRAQNRSRQNQSPISAKKRRTIQKIQRQTQQKIRPYNRQIRMAKKPLKPLQAQKLALNTALNSARAVYATVMLFLALAILIMLILCIIIVTIPYMIAGIGIASRFMATASARYKQVSQSLNKQIRLLNKQINSVKEQISRIQTIIMTLQRTANAKIQRLQKK